MRYIVLALFIISANPLFSQSKKNLKAKELVNQGMLLEGSMSLDEACELYKKAVKTDPNYSTAWYQYSNCLRKLGKEESNQLNGFKKVIELDSTTKNNLNANNILSSIYYQQGKFDTSLTYFHAYLNHSLLKSKEKALKELPQREFAAKSYSHPINMEPWPLHDWINEVNSLQYFPILTGDEKKLIFTRRPKGSQNEDIYISLFIGDWQEPDKLPGTINSQEAEGTATISADGNTIICSYCSNLRENFGNCDLYYSVLKGVEWSELKNLGPAINTAGYESQPSLSADGRTLYFVSDREGGIGDLDIWMSKLNKNNEWIDPVNMGDKINTVKSEGSPFIHANGSSLFFASKGHLGMGGYDLFLSEFDNNEWGESRNLGYPINDQNNQISLFVTANGKQGYFNKEEYTKGSLTPNQSRIWMFDVPKELKLGHRSNYVKGKVFDNLTKMPIEANIKLINLETEEEVAITTSNILNGSYLIMLTEGAEYAFYVEAKGHLFKSVAFDYKEKRDFDPINLDLFLDPIVKGVTVQLNNIYFELGKAVLKSKSKVELDKLYQLMKLNPSLKIELGGHSDNTGSEAINLTLSQKRVDAVKAHLVKKGIAANRMVGKGYGESKPVATNDTEEGRRQNRRVEFTVL